MAKKFFYVCAGVFLLALSYHLGAGSASAQAPGNPVVASFGGNAPEVVTANGDVYIGGNGSAGSWTNWVLVSNVFSGAATPAARQSWGSLKAKYR